MAPDLKHYGRGSAARYGGAAGNQRSHWATSAPRRRSLHCRCPLRPVEAGTLREVPYIGPSSARHHRLSSRDRWLATVEAACRGVVPRTAPSARLRQLRANFLSQFAMESGAGAAGGDGVVSKAPAGDFRCTPRGVMR